MSKNGIERGLTRMEERAAAPSGSVPTVEHAPPNPDGNSTEPETRQERLRTLVIREMLAKKISGGEATRLNWKIPVLCSRQKGGGIYARSK